MKWCSVGFAESIVSIAQKTASWSVDNDRKKAGIIANGMIYQKFFNIYLLDRAVYFIGNTSIVIIP